MSRKKFMTQLGTDKAKLIEPTLQDAKEITQRVIDAKLNDAAIAIYEEKVKKYPELAVIKTEDPADKKKNKRNNMMGATRTMDAIMKEKITDDLGREIEFKRPNGDKLANKRPFFVKPLGKESPKKIKLKKPFRPLPLNDVEVPFLPGQ